MFDFAGEEEKSIREAVSVPYLLDLLGRAAAAPSIGSASLGAYPDYC